MSVSLHIPTYNRTGLLRKSLLRLSKLTLPDEIIVVNDGGEAEELQYLCVEATHWLAPARVRYVYTDNPGYTMCSHARNVALRMTECDLVVGCEPEVIFVTDVIAQFLALHEERPHLVVCAGTGHFPNMLGVGLERIHTPRVARRELATSPMACLYGRREWLTRIGGWDEQFPEPYGLEDIDLFTRLRVTGHPSVDAPEVEILHQFHGSTIRPTHLNEQYMDAKTSLVANEGLDWGRPK